MRTVLWFIALAFLINNQSLNQLCITSMLIALPISVGVDMLEMIYWNETVNFMKNNDPSSKK